MAAPATGSTTALARPVPWGRVRECWSGTKHAHAVVCAYETAWKAGRTCAKAFQETDSALLSGAQRRSSHQGSRAT